MFVNLVVHHIFFRLTKMFFFICSAKQFYQDGFRVGGGGGGYLDAPSLRVSIPWRLKGSAFVLFRDIHFEDGK